MKFKFLIVATFLGLNTYAQNDEKYVPDALREQVVPLYMLGAVKQIKFNHSTASCYIHNDSNSTFIVTVKHLFTTAVTRFRIENKKKVFYQVDSLLCKENSVVTVDLFDQNGWRQTTGNIHYSNSPNENIDIAVIQYKEKTNYNSLYLLDEANFILGQHCYFCGYPLGFKTLADSALGYNIPLLKFAVFSGASKDSNTGESIFFLDGNNTYGLSGGPVLYYNFYLKKWRIAGMICGYYRQSSNVFNSQTGKNEIREENSGVIKSIGSKQILDLINSLRK